MRFVGVVVNKKTTALNRIFYYSVPAELADQVHLGQIVEVDFASQRLEAIVVEEADAVDWPPEKIKPLRRVISSQPLFGPDLLALSRFAAEYYLCSWVSMLQAMLPAGMYLTGKMPRTQTRRLAQLTSEEADWAGLRGVKQKRVLSCLQAAGGPLSLPELLEQTGASLATVRTLAERGLLQLTEELIWEGEPSVAPKPRPELSPDQKRALAEIRENFASYNNDSPKKPVLLHGVTGSGKTEINLRLADEQRDRKNVV